MAKFKELGYYKTMPKITSFVIVESARVKRGKEVAPSAPAKSAPHYFEKTVPNQFILNQNKSKIGDIEVDLIAKTYPPDVILVEGTVEVSDIFAEEILELKDKVHDLCFEVAQKNGGKNEPSEEYTVYQIFDYKGDPELFLQKNSQKITGLLKSEKLELDEKEVEYTLSFQLKYAKDDLAIVDWDGAFLFDPEGEFGETIELLELANFQLLRYRMLDRDLDERLQKVSKLTQWEGGGRWFRTKEVAQAFREVIKIRSQSIAEFEALERDIKLIGDWYSARLYDLISKKFRLDAWSQTIKEKLDSLEDAYDIVSENLGMSRMQVLEFIQIGAFFVLQIGWFVLIILEFFYFTR
jgi:hypothetical protein